MKQRRNTTLQRPKSHAARYREIIDILFRNGFGYLFDISNIDNILPVHRFLKQQRADRHRFSSAERVRMVLEELGPVFIKLGQILSTRIDLISPLLQTELAKLQDAAPPVAFDDIRSAIEQELGKPITELFASFDETPLAAASIGQVHAATLHDGAEVVVKVRRPGVNAVIEIDLAILQQLARSVSNRVSFVQQYDVPGLAREFSQTLLAELDYIREGHNAEHFARNFHNEPDVHIPVIFWEQTTHCILTLERIIGTKITDIDALHAQGFDIHKLAEKTSSLILKMVFEDGFYHADPHPGNFFILPNSRIGIIDFGMVGSVDVRSQEKLVQLIIALTSHNMESLVDTMLDLGVARQRVDRASLEHDVEMFVNRYYDQSLGDIQVSVLIQEALSLVRAHHLQLPASMSILLKTVAMDEGLGLLLDPNFHLTTVLGPYAQRMIMQQFDPLRWTRKMSQAGIDTLWLGTELPKRLRRVLGDLERGTLQIGPQADTIDPILNRFETIANRIILGILAAAFINGLAVLMSATHNGPVNQLLQIFFVIGFILASGLGIVLAMLILRSWRI